MLIDLAPSRTPLLARAFDVNPLLALSVLLGVVMPIASGLIYPTYFHMMRNEWLEWTRLLEIQFLVAELLVIHVAFYKRLDVASVLRGLSGVSRLALVMFVTGVWFSSLFVSANPTYSAALSLATVIHVLFALSVFHLVRLAGIPSIKDFAIPMCVGLVLIALYTVWRFKFPIDAALVPGGKIEWDFAIPGFISVRYLGIYAGALTAFFIALVMTERNKGGASFAEFGVFVAMSMAIWTGTRAAVFGCFVAIALMLLITRRLPPFAVIARMALITGLAVAVSQALLPAGQPVFQLFDPGETSNVDQLSSGRIEMWAATIDTWRKAPLFGLGSGSIFWEIDFGWTHTQPHNAILQFLLSWGLVGTIGALWLFGLAIYKGQQNTNRNPELWPFTAMLYALLAMSMVDGALYYPRLVIMIMLCFAVTFPARTARA